jgi:hypothetical protein
VTFALELLRYLGIAAFVGLALITYVQWRRGRHPASMWVFLAFMVLAVISLIGLVQPDDLGDSAAALLFIKFEVGVLVLFPFFLYRVSATFTQGNRVNDWLALALTAGVIVWGFTLPEFPGEGDPRSTLFLAYLTGLLAQWTFLSVVVAVRFWRAGQGQTFVAKTRMRMLSIASIALSVGLIVAGAASGSPEEDAVEFVTRSITLLSVVAFFLAFAPPKLLRTIWRRPVEDSLRQGTIDLMSATSEEEVTGFLLPRALSIVGGEAIAIVDPDGRVVGSRGFESSSLDEARLLLNAATAEEHEKLSPDLVSLRFAFGWLLLKTGPYTTYFGREEVELLGALGALANLAIERVHAADLRLALAQAQLRRQQALEINDNIVQGLAVAKYAIDLGQSDRARTAVEGTLAAARRIISDLVDELGDDMQLGPGTLTRDRAASGFQEGASEKEAG